MNNQQSTVQVKRNPIHKISIGRDNPIVLSVRGNNQSVKIILQDYYPREFATSIKGFQLTLEAKTNQDLMYTFNPKNRGKFQWGGVQIRKLTPLIIIHRSTLRLLPDNCLNRAVLGAW